ncbi:HAD family hydrolase [Tessaracoccus antarcticus]|uniref:HAD family phosphatase n=1 Tax=Tessaracoccus antarcticus TaxID=2479848 RepID=A0A3M0G6Y5_9ACTN|nr:HAD family phosphatase [Tessaracoccus antarcticus]RMB59887.1 HAD family phosphatase [Tessaracoccus antarcticus]
MKPTTPQGVAIVPSLPSRIGAILFDMDNTLVDSEHAWFEATADLWRHAGSQPDGVGVLGGTVADVIREFLAAHPDADPEPVERRFMEFLHHHLADGVVTMPGAEELLTRMAPILPVAIASNSPSVIVRDTVARMGWSSLFTAAVGTEDVAQGKPAPDLYLYAARACGVAPETCVVIEDSPMGAAAGRAAGAFVLTVGDVAADHGDLNIDSLTDPRILAWTPERAS